MAEEKIKTESKKNTKGKTTTKKSTPKTKNTTVKSTSEVNSKTTKITPKKTTSASKNKATTKKSTPKTTSSATKSTSKLTSKTTKTSSKKTTSKTSSKPVSIESVKNKNDKTIEISKRKLIIGMIMVFLIILLFLVCFLGSNSVSKKYSKVSTNNNTNTSSSEGKDILEQATKEAGEISDEQRTAPTNISVDDYIELYKGDDASLVLLSKESCGYCQIAVPIIENIIYESGVKINHVDVGEMSSEDSAKLISSDDYFSKGYGTPLLIVVGENSIKDKIEGLTTKELYIEFFKKHGFME